MKFVGKSLPRKHTVRQIDYDAVAEQLKAYPRRWALIAEDSPSQNLGQKQLKALGIRHRSHTRYIEEGKKVWDIYAVYEPKEGETNEE